MSPTLLLTRPEAEARRFLTAVCAQLGAVDCIIAPVMTIRTVPFELPAFDVAVLTSAQAVQVLGAALQSKRVICVGAETATAAQTMGAVVQIVAQTADDLVAQAQDMEGAVYFRGEHVARDLASRLRIADVVIYAQASTPLSPEALALISSGDQVIVPVFSRRSAELVNSQVEKWPPNVHIIAMSAAVAEVFQPQVSILPEPTGKQMLSAVVAALKEKT